MRFSGKLALKVGAISVAAGAILLPVTAAHAAGPAITVTPNTGLNNGDSVTVDGTGYTAGATVAVLECADAPVTASTQCDTSAFATNTATVGQDGSFTKSITVKTGTIGSGTCDAGSSTCAIVAGNVTVQTEAASEGITFADAPTTPTITVSPSTGVTNGGTITVSGAGFPATATNINLVECSAPGAQSHCDLSTFASGAVTGGAFSGVTMIVHDGMVGDGTCADGGTCYIAGSTVQSGADATNSGVGTFSFAATQLPSVTATPNTGIVNGTAISVHGLNFAPNTGYAISECSGTGASSHCDSTVSDLVFGNTGADGSFTNTFDAKTGTIGDGVCNAGSTCYLAATTNLATTGGDDTNTAFAEIDFKPTTGPVVTVTPSTNVKDGGSVQVTATGFPKKVETAYIVECGLQAGTNGSQCDTSNLGQPKTKADGTLSFTFTGVHTGKLGTDGHCKAGGKCTIAVTTDPTGTKPDQSAAGVFTFAKGGGVHPTKPAKTKTEAKFSKKSGEIDGAVTSGGKGVKGLKTKLEVKAGKKWKKVDSESTHKGGAFDYKIKKSGKYEVVTASSKAYKGSHSKKIKAKV